MDQKKLALKQIRDRVKKALEESKANLKRWEDAGDHYESLQAYCRGRVDALSFINGIVEIWVKDEDLN